MASSVIFVNGITGPNATTCNGTFEPTAEQFEGMLRYVKRGNSNVWLEYYGGQWQIKSTENKGNNIYWANIVCAKRLPEQCASGTWQVHDGSYFFDCPGVRVVTEAVAAREHAAEAERFSRDATADEPALVIEVVHPAVTHTLQGNIENLSHQSYSVLIAIRFNIC
jgi:hypothetical protein